MADQIMREDDDMQQHKLPSNQVFHQALPKQQILL